MNGVSFNNNNILGNKPTNFQEKIDKQIESLRTETKALQTPAKSVEKAAITSFFQLYKVLPSFLKSAMIPSAILKAPSVKLMTSLCTIEQIDDKGIKAVAVQICNLYSSKIPEDASLIFFIEKNYEQIKGIAESGKMLESHILPPLSNLVITYILPTKDELFADFPLD